MKTSTRRGREKSRELRRRFRAAGIPVSFESENDEVPELLIRQDFDTYDTFVFNFGARSGLILPLKIVPNISIFVFSSFDICLPRWPNAWFRLLEENVGDRWPHYQLGGRSEFKFSRAEVINRFIEGQKIVRRGHPIRGLLLATSHERLPDDLLRGDVLRGSIKIFDQFEHEHQADVSVRVDREVELEFEPDPRRERLFARS
jgi:hypothetical protein